MTQRADESLIIRGVVARGNKRRLLVRLRSDTSGAHVGNPQLNWAQPIGSHVCPMGTHACRNR